MNDPLKKLQEISQELEDINMQMNDEAKVYAAELEERKRLGIEGDAAIIHFNEWMDRHSCEQVLILQIRVMAVPFFS